MEHSAANRWYVTVEPRTPRRTKSPAPYRRQTKAFPTEIEAKLFAKAMLIDGLRVTTAGTLSPHQPTRRAISPSAILDWIDEPPNGPSHLKC
ncbi:MAG TPA: hypothetical protein VKB53_02755 [Gammaproteobacteria bacterium]|nr:hypothetical protein [Gammaproteobacteria bacterium]